LTANIVTTRNKKTRFVH